MKDLEQLRKEIEKIDSDLVALMIRRNEVAKEIGQIKSRTGADLRNIEVEKKVIERYRMLSSNTLLPQDVAESVCRLLIDSSVELQSSLLKKKCSKKISIIGGSGGMGQWLKRYFEGMGAEVKIIGRSSGKPEDARDSDVVIISVPPSAVASTLKKIDTVCRKDALIFDISSIKSPFAKEIKELAQRRKVCSVHHMFGPSAATMLNRNVVICDCGNKTAVKEAADLFDNEGSNLIFTTIERHDQLTAYVLAFAHASNIVFFTALRESGIPFDDLNKVASTTFKRCLSSSIPVSEENAPLYHEIQRLNDNIEEMWAVFERALKQVKKASLSKDPDQFVKIMENGKEYFGR